MPAYRGAPGVIEMGRRADRRVIVTTSYGLDRARRDGEVLRARDARLNRLVAMKVRLVGTRE